MYYFFFREVRKTHAALQTNNRDQFCIVNHIKQHWPGANSGESDGGDCSPMNFKICKNIFLHMI